MVEYNNVFEYSPLLTCRYRHRYRCNYPIADTVALKVPVRGL